MKRSLLFLILFTLPACWSRTQVRQPQSVDLSNAVYTVTSVSDSTHQVPDTLMAEMKTYLEKVLAEAESYSDKSGDGIYEVSVDVKNYNMREKILRLFFGGWAGRDSIESRVVVKDHGGTTVADARISTFNQTASGGGESMVPANVRDIAKYLAGKKVRK